jgi:hypothetical protein
MTNQNAEKIYESMKKTFLDKLNDEEKERYQKFGEKFYNSFNVETGNPFDTNTINMEESLAYVIESIKSGLHPKYLTEDEQMLIRAGYGDHWYTKFGYDSIE